MMFAQERKKIILDILHKKRRVTNQELSQELGVSTTTIRTYVSELEKQNLLVRTHGGAMLRDDLISIEETMSDREGKHESQKRQIASIALQFISKGDTIILDTGTTCLEIAKALIDFDALTVITNDLQVAHELQKNKHIQLLFLGGTVRNHYDCTIGASVIDALGSLSVDSAFIAANAMSNEWVVSTPNLETAEVKKAMMRSSQKNYLVMDATKIGKRTLCGFANLDEFNAFITSDAITEEQRYLCIEKGIKVCTQVDG